MDPVEDINTLIKSRYPIIGVQSWEEERVVSILDQVSLLVHIPLFVWSSTTGLSRFPQKTGIYNSLEPMQALNTIDSGTDAIYLLKDFHHYLEDKLIIRKLRDLCASFAKSYKSIIISAPTINPPTELKKEFVLYDLKLPDRDEVYKIMLKTLKDLADRMSFAIKLSNTEIEKLAHQMTGLTLREIERIISRAILRDHVLGEQDIDLILQFKKDIIEKGGLLEYYYDPVSIPYIGGFTKFKTWLKKRRMAFSEKAKEAGLKPPKGVLLLGVPGCGKSLCSKIIAKFWRIPLLKLDPSALYDKYIGETEKNLRTVFKLSEAMSPAVLWIDEIEKGFTFSGSSESDGGLGRRILGTFLNWMQEKESPVFIVATCNDVQRLPPEFLRKGRFDEIFFVDLPNLKARAEIFKIVMLKHKQDWEKFDIKKLAENSDGFSGAEIEQAVISALYSAFSGQGVITTELILDELGQTHPLSVTRNEDIENLRRWAHGRAVLAD
ncbi:AAA family ATPase [bacterium]|nr:AAA family ATPase [bacterium]